MNDKKIRICIFIHYSTTASLPFYVQIYIEELSRHFDKVKVLSNNSKIKNEDYTFSKNIDFNYFQNQGYDFGMFYRFIVKENLDSYSQIAIVNDSNILLKPLDNVFKWAQNNESDFWGIIDSNEKPWFSTHEENYHIQSHFLILNENAIKLLPTFFNKLNIEELMNEPDPKQLRRMVIDKWEIGLTRFFIEKGLKSFSFIDSKKEQIKFKTKKHNLTHTHFSELLSIGYPLLKKKVATEKRKRIWGKKESVKSVITKYSNPDWDIEKIFEEIKE